MTTNKKRLKNTQSHFFDDGITGNTPISIKDATSNMSLGSLFRPDVIEKMVEESSTKPDSTSKIFIHGNTLYIKRTTVQTFMLNEVLPTSISNRREDGNIGKREDGNTGKREDGNTGKREDGNIGKREDGNTGKANTTQLDDFPITPLVRQKEGHAVTTSSSKTQLISSSKTQLISSSKTILQSDDYQRILEEYGLFKNEEGFLNTLKSKYKGIFFSISSSCLDIFKNNDSMLLEAWTAYLFKKVEDGVISHRKMGEIDYFFVKQ